MVMMSVLLLSVSCSSREIGFVVKYMPVGSTRTVWLLGVLDVAWS